MSRAWVLWVGLAAGLTGCVGSKADKVQGRSQIGEDPAGDPDAFATLGWKTTVGNTEAIPVSGVGLVYGLKGTGSSPPPGGWRTMLEQSLRKQGYNETKTLLDDPNKTTSLVIVSALIPAGARKGEPIDVQIALPDDSRTTSLKGGQLFHCDLVTSDTTGNLRSLAKEGTPTGPSGGLVLGSVLASAQGPVVAGTFSPTGSASRETGADPENGPPALKVGRVWGGGVVKQSRPYYFLMNPGDQNVRMAATVADRLVSTFHATAEPGSKVAEAKTRELVLVNVPPAYRHNHYRFLLVARQVPLLPVTSDSIYRRKLETELLDPATALTAAIKLEALGGDSHRSLRLGLRDSSSPWVRFAAAEALAYLGQTDGAEELARLAEEHPAVRAQCLKALASLDDGASLDRLVELMGKPDPSLRYGAFVALRLADDRNPAVGGQLVNTSYWLHRVAPGSPGLVHLTADRRSEIVLFGDGLKLRGPFTLPVGSEFAVSMSATDPEVKVSRVVRVKGEAEVKELRCKPELADVLVTVAKLGGGHGEAVELLMRADRAQVLSAALAAGTLPREMTVQQLASFAAKDDPTLARADVEVTKVGALPNPDQLDYNLPGSQDAEAKAAEQAPPRPPLSQNPGRIFGPKRPPEPPTEPIAPASGTTPADAQSRPPLSQSPGTLFGRKKGN
jgi:hypothetical protein